MSVRHFRFSGRAALFASAAAISLAGGASAADKPATAAGAKKISDVFATYAGKAAGSPPALVVTPEGTDYAIAFDIGALTTPMSGAGVGYEPAVLKYKFHEQDDGAWRIEQTELPPLVSHAKRGEHTVDSTMTFTGVNFLTVFDPATSWIRSSKGAAEKAVIHQTGPGVDDTIEMSALAIDSVGKSTADGVVAMDAHETLGGMTMKMAMDPKVANPKAAAGPIDFTLRSDKADVNVKVDGVKIHPLLDLWAFLVAHPTREALAGDEADLKRLATAVVASQVTLHEDGAASKMSVQTQPGVFTIEGLKGAVTLAALGPASRFEESVSASSLKLPDGLIPPMFHDIIPTSFDVGVKVTGFDLTAGGDEMVADLHLAGEAAVLSKPDGDKIFAKMLGAGPLVIEIAPSHVIAPQLDIAFEGKINYVGGKPTGAITVRMRNFDKTVTAMKALPNAETSVLPVLTMAKGLAKNDADGSLLWVGEIGADRVMKVNGLPLGKAPF